MFFSAITTGCKLQPLALDSFSQLILLFVFLFYLIILKKRKDKNTWLVIFFNLFSSTYIVGEFLRKAYLHVPWTFPILQFSMMGPTVGLVFLLQFVYRFPYLPQKNKKEANVILVLSIINTAYIIFVQLFQGDVGSLHQNISLAFFYTWVIVVLLRKTIELSRQTNDSLSAFKGILHPQGKFARATRSFAISIIFPTGFPVVTMMRYMGVISSVAASLAFHTIMVLTIASFAFVYLSYDSEQVSFITRFSGFFLMASLLVMSVIGMVQEPLFLSDALSGQNNILRERTSFRFIPMDGNSYQLKHIPFEYNELSGQRFEMGEDGFVRISLKFPFSYYGKVWHEAYVSHNGVLTFGEPFDIYDFGMGKITAIFPRMIDLDHTDGGGVYVYQDEEKIIINWDKLNALGRDYPNSIQLVLYPDGAFDFVYKETEPGWRDYALLLPFQSAWQVGFLPRKRSIT